jgi:Kef-type K+ transport system membrane component KefB
MEAFTQLTIFLILIILLARLAVVLSRRFDIPAVTIQLLIGILIGPTLLNLLGAPLVFGTWGSISPSLLHSVLRILAEIGLIQLMFLAGLQTDWHKLKTDLKSIFSMSVWSFILAAVGIAIVARWFVDRWTEALAVSAIMAAVSFGISVYNFNEMKFLESRAAKIVLGTAVMNGLLAILLMIASQATNYAVIHGAFRMTVAVSWLLGKLIMFFAIAYFLTSRFLSRIAKIGFEKRPRQALIGYLLLVAALYAWGAMHFGSFAAVGVASLGGALLGMSSLGLKEKIASGFGPGLASLPMGVLFVVLGMEVNFKGVEGNIIFLAMLLVTALAAKLTGGWIVTRKGFESSRERVLIRVGALYPGEMGMLIAAYLFSRGIVNPSQFNLTIIVVVILTMITPVLMKMAAVKLNLQSTSVQVSELQNRKPSSVPL